MFTEREHCNLRGLWSFRVVAETGAAIQNAGFAFYDRNGLHREEIPSVPLSFHRLHLTGDWLSLLSGWMRRLRARESDDSAPAWTAGLRGFSAPCESFGGAPSLQCWARMFVD